MVLDSHQTSRGYTRLSFSTIANNTELKCTVLFKDGTEHTESLTIDDDISSIMIESPIDDPHLLVNTVTVTSASDISNGEIEVHQFIPKLPEISNGWWETMKIQNKPIFDSVSPEDANNYKSIIKFYNSIYKDITQPIYVDSIIIKDTFDDYSIIDKDTFDDDSIIDKDKLDKGYLFTLYHQTSTTSTTSTPSTTSTTSTTNIKHLFIDSDIRPQDFEIMVENLKTVTFGSFYGYYIDKDLIQTEIKGKFMRIGLYGYSNTDPYPTIIGNKAQIFDFSKATALKVLTYGHSYSKHVAHNLLGVYTDGVYTDGGYTDGTYSSYLPESVEQLTLGHYFGSLSHDSISGNRTDVTDGTEEVSMDTRGKGKKPKPVAGDSLSRDAIETLGYAYIGPPLKVTPKSISYLSHLTKLKILRLGPKFGSHPGCTLGANNFSNLAKLTKLEELKIGNNSGDDCFGRARTKEGLDYFSKVETGNSKDPYGGIIGFGKTSYLTGLTELKKLELGYNFGMMGTAALGDETTSYLAGLTKLKKLELGYYFGKYTNAKIGHDHTSYLAGLTELKKLELGYYFGTHDTATLGYYSTSYLGGLSNLTEFELGSQFGTCGTATLGYYDKVGKTTTSYLGDLGKLKTLDLGHCFGTHDTARLGYDSTSYLGGLSNLTEFTVGNSCPELGYETTSYLAGLLVLKIVTVGTGDLTYFHESKVIQDHYRPLVLLKNFGIEMQTGLPKFYKTIINIYKPISNILLSTDRKTNYLENLTSIEKITLRGIEILNDQNKTINDQTKTINDQTNTINDQNKTINDQNKTINDQTKTINDQTKTINDQTKTIQYIQLFSICTITTITIVSLIKLKP